MLTWSSYFKQAIFKPCMCSFVAEVLHQNVWIALTRLIALDDFDLELHGLCRDTCIWNSVLLQILLTKQSFWKVFSELIWRNVVFLNKQELVRKKIENSGLTSIPVCNLELEINVLRGCNKNYSSSEFSFIKSILIKLVE